MSQVEQLSSRKREQCEFMPRDKKKEQANKKQIGVKAPRADGF